VTEVEANGENATPIIPAPNPVTPPSKKAFRKVKVQPSEDGLFYYVALDRKGEPLYTSETFTRKSTAINAARREHEGRNERFDYVLEYENSKGYLVRETL